MRLRTGAAIIGTLFIAISLISCNANNTKFSFPQNCDESGFEFQGSSVILNPGSKQKQSLYLICNTSDSDFWLTHPVKDPSASAGWNSDIDPGNWSAFTVNMPDFELTCTKSGQGSLDTLPCKRVIKMCRITKPVFKPDMNGNYWVSEDKPLEAVIDEIKTRGIGW
jgi:hypothetical protein